MTVTAVRAPRIRHQRSEVPSFGAARRLQALAAIGWSLPALAKATGLPDNTLRAVRDLTVTRTRPEVEQAVAAVYDRLWDQRPDTSTIKAKQWVTRTVALAESLGWAKPLMWDDEDLDDPDGQPWTEDDFLPVCPHCNGSGRLPTKGWHAPLTLTPLDFTRQCRNCEGRGKQKSQQCRENQIDLDDVELLATSGCTWQQAADRLGVARDSLYVKLHRANETRLARLLALNTSAKSDEYTGLGAWIGSGSALTVAS